MNTFSKNTQLFIVLIQRHMLVLTKSLQDTIIDKSILVISYVIIFGHFFPLLGMSTSYVAPVYIGNMILLTLSLGSSMALSIVFDLKYHHYISYELTLPLPKRWLFASYVAKYLINFTLSTLPLFFAGIILLGDLFSTKHIQWFPFFSLYLLSLVFMAIMLITTAFWYSYEWYMANVWARRIALLLTCSCLFISWLQVYALSNIIGYLFLLNPITYIVEGLRATLLNSTLYLSPFYCASALLMYSILMSYALQSAIKRALDPV
jgi:ABC-type polysaccharide/polyol phosphate export permease